jgi:hypothetical protein
MPHTEFSAYKSTTLLPSTVMAANITMTVPFFDDHAKKSVPTATRSRREQTSSWHKLLRL